MDETDWAKLCSSSMGMSAEDVAHAESAVASDPDAVEPRVKLVGAYHSAMWDREKQAKRDAHIHWLIRHRPEIGLGPIGGIFPFVTPRGYAEAKRLWLEAVDQRPDDARVLRNASLFLVLEDPAIAEELSFRGISLAPSPEWHSTLAALNELRAETAPQSQRSELAMTIVEQHEQALALLDDVEQRYVHSIDIARWAIEAGDVAKARHHAMLVLDEAQRLDAKRSHCHGPYWAHISLGKVALTEGNLGSASEHLVAAAAPGTAFHDDGVPVGRPDLALAAALLARGERDTVVRYLLALELLWPEKTTSVRAKREEVERGEAADLEEIHRQEQERRATMQRILRERACDRS